jgi:hypothetical protein
MVRLPLVSESKSLLHHHGMLIISTTLKHLFAHYKYLFAHKAKYGAVEAGKFVLLTNFLQKIKSRHETLINRGLNCCRNVIL